MSGACDMCGEPAASGRRKCPKHLESDRVESLATYKELRAAGVCVWCREVDARPGMTMCGPCAERKARATAERHVRLREAGVCVDCHAADARPNRATCGPCGADRARRRRERAARLAAERWLTATLARPQTTCSGTNDGRG